MSPSLIPQSIALATPPLGPYCLTILVISLIELQGVAVRGMVEMMGNMADTVLDLGKILQGLQSQGIQMVSWDQPGVRWRSSGLDHIP